MRSNQAINIAEVAYADFSALPAPVLPNWVYILYWNATISQSIDAKSRSNKTFGSFPPRYSFGHLTAYDNTSVSWDDTLRFEDQKSALFRTHIRQGNPNPGGVAPEFPTPLEIRAVVSYDSSDTSLAMSAISAARANTLGVFLTADSEAFALFNYFGFLVYDSADIAINQSIIGVFP